MTSSINALNFDKVILKDYWVSNEITTKNHICYTAPGVDKLNSNKFIVSHSNTKI